MTTPPGPTNPDESTAPETTSPPDAAPAPHGTPLLGWRAEQRPSPGIARAFGAAAGVLAAAAVVLLVAWIDRQDPQVPGALLTAALVAASLAAATFLAGPVRSAALTALAVSVPAFWLFVIFGSNASFEHGDVTLFFVLTMLTLLVLYGVVRPSRGHTVLLAVALVLLAGWLQFEVRDASSPFPFQDEAVRVVQRGVGGGTDTTAAIVGLAVGLAYLAIGITTDRRRLTGLATPFVVLGGIHTVGGAVALGADESVKVAGIAAALAGVVVGTAGSRTGRRFTTWLGGVAALGGAVAVVVDLADDDIGNAFGLTAGAAAVLLAIAWLLSRFSGESTDGEGQLGVPTLRGPGAPPAPPDPGVSPEEMPELWASPPPVTPPAAELAAPPEPAPPE